MIIRSDYLTEGLFGQAFTWLLEILPHVDRQQWKPEWQILTKNYGQAPSFNIFPGIIAAQYEPDSCTNVVAFEHLQRMHKHNFKHDFERAHDTWNLHFRFSSDVRERLEDFCERNFAGRVVLGVHYRGTDKNVDTYQTNPVTRYQFLCVVEDFLSSHPEIDTIFVASDDHPFVEAMSRFKNVVTYEQNRSANGRPLWNQHSADSNQAMAKEAILDCLTLSRCQFGLKCMSQLSAFSKVMNPSLQMFRVSACKTNWFPEAFIPRYQSGNRSTQALLNVIQADDYQSNLIERTTGLHRRISRLSKQVWRKTFKLPLDHK